MKHFLTQRKGITAGSPPARGRGLKLGHKTNAERPGRRPLRGGVD